MVPILVGNPEKGTHVTISIIWSVYCIWLDQAQSQIGLFIVHVYTTCSELPSKYKYHCIGKVKNRMKNEENEITLTNQSSR